MTESSMMNIKINNLDYDCLLMIFSYFPLEERFKIKNGNYQFTKYQLNFYKIII